MPDQIIREGGREYKFAHLYNRVIGSLGEPGDIRNRFNFSNTGQPTKPWNDEVQSITFAIEPYSK